MAWIILEGLDRSGKSTVAKLYQAKGFKVIHMEAPDKKYTKPGYAGPSYMDEMMDLYMKYNAQDVIFDRSPYGEFVWPIVYGRMAQLTDEDVEVLQEIENNNDIKRLLFHDVNTDAHWKRCVDNKEPLTRPQFNNANILFDRMGAKYGFEKAQLTDYAAEISAVGYIPQKPPILKQGEPQTIAAKIDGTTVTFSIPSEPLSKSTKSNEQLKLEKANAINELLSSRIVKKKGETFDELEKDIRIFLDNRLAGIFGKDLTNMTSFSKDEVEILKMHCKQVIKKMEKL